MADELGSGVRNVFRYGPEYARGAVPELIEGDVFKTMIPLRVREIAQVKTSADWSQIRSKFGAKFGAKFGVKFGVNSEKIMDLLFQDPGLSAAGIAERIDISVRAVEKQLAQLKEMGAIERVGADKNGHWRIMLDD